MDSAHLKMSENRYYTLFYDKRFKNWNYNMVTCDHLGFMQIRKFAQSCRWATKLNLFNDPMPVQIHQKTS